MASGMGAWHKPVADVLSKKVVFPILFDLTSEKLNGLILDKLNSGSDLSVYLQSWIGEFDIFTGLNIDESFDPSFSLEVSTLVNRFIIDPIISGVSVIISFLLLYLVFRIALYLTFYLFVRFTNKGMIGVVNKVFGFVVAFVVIFSFNCFLARLTNRIISIDTIKNAAWAHGFEGGRVFTFFKEMSPLDLLLNINFK